MRHRWIALAFVTALASCARAPARSPAPPPAEAAAPPEPPDAPVETAEQETTEPTPTVEAPERARPPSTASYEQALATPERVDVGDEHAHLTDAQLTSPMGGVLAGCRVPGNAKVTIKTAVQYGRAIGVTVDVRLDKPKSTKRPKPAAVKAERKAIAKIAACIDRHVRAVVWPPNRRRDSFTMTM